MGLFKQCGSIENSNGLLLYSALDLVLSRVQVVVIVIVFVASLLFILHSGLQACKQARHLECWSLWVGLLAPLDLLVFLLVVSLVGNGENTSRSLVWDLLPFLVGVRLLVRLACGTAAYDVVVEITLHKSLSFERKIPELPHGRHHVGVEVGAGDDPRHVATLAGGGNDSSGDELAAGKELDVTRLRLVTGHFKDVWH
jgi:hypothetical protein